MDPRVYALSFHADYKCQRSGVCCTSDWDVPVEVSLYRDLSEALRSSRLHAAAEDSEGKGALLVDDELPGDTGAMVARTDRGDCVFYHRGSGLCVIQRDVGEDHLPATCRHFPRLAVRDWRGTLVTLSHYCPTAAGMLFRDDIAIAIVENPPAFPPADYEGLTVEQDAWPPLLHPRMLMDADAYAAWERHMVRRCADVALLPDAIVATLERDARIIRAFTPGDTSLAEAIASLPRSGAHGLLSFARSLELFEDVRLAIPDDMRPEPDEHDLHHAHDHRVAPLWPDWADPVRKYLAAKAFASWTAYQGRGVLTIVRGLEAALACVKVEAARQCRNARTSLDAALLKEAFRQADFILNHLAVGEELALRWSRVEI